MVVRHWNRLTREGVDAPAPAVFKSRLGKALSNLFWWEVSHGREDWDQVVFKGHANLLTLCDSMSLWSLCLAHKRDILFYFSSWKSLFWSDQMNDPETKGSADCLVCLYLNVTELPTHFQILLQRNWAEETVQGLEMFWMSTLFYCSFNFSSKKDVLFCYLPYHTWYISSMLLTGKLVFQM